MKLFLSLATSICLIISNSKSQVPFSDLNPGKVYEFEKQEIRDSGFKTVLVHMLYSDHIGKDVYNWRDTLYIAKFNIQGVIVYEKKMTRFQDSIVNVYYYSDSMYLEKRTSSHYDLIHAGRVSVKTTWYDRNGKILQEEDETTRKGSMTKLSLLRYKYDIEGKLIKVVSGEPGNKKVIRMYTYDKTGRIIQDSRVLYDSYSYEHRFKYLVNGNDSTVEIIGIEKAGKEIDSFVYRRVYNKNGNLVEESRKVSPTYFKTFNMDCSTGETFKDTYQYDEYGRKILEDKDGVVFKIRYTEFGYIRNFFSSVERYDRIEKTIYGQRFLRETYDLSSKLTTFLSEKSKLILTIDISENARYGNAKYFFDYEK